MLAKSVSKFWIRKRSHPTFCRFYNRMSATAAPPPPVAADEICEGFLILHQMRMVSSTLPYEKVVNGIEFSFLVNED